MIVSKISGINYKRVSNEKYTQETYAQRNYNYRNKVSFLGIEKYNIFEKILMKMQRAYHNRGGRKSHQLMLKFGGIINNVDRVNRSPAEISEIKEYCSQIGAEFAGTIQITSRADKKHQNGFVIIRRLSPNTNYSQLPETNLMDKTFVNTTLQGMVDATKKEPLSARLEGVPKGCGQIKENTCLVEILDTYGLPIGVHFLDANKDIVVGNGVRNIEPSTYSNVGRSLNDIKALIAHLTGSNKVTMFSDDVAQQFNIKCGYRFTPDKKECGAGKMMYLPEDELLKILAKYEHTDLYKGLVKALENLGLT